MSFFARPEAERYRLDIPEYGPGDEQNGIFRIPEMGLRIICSSGLGWEHVSVSKKTMVPRYEELTYVKDLFWGPEDCAMQLFVPEAEHINCHPNCLHLWRPVDGEIPRPPGLLVGIIA